MAELLAAALGYAAAGWPVHPCWWTTEHGCGCGEAGCGSPGKHPLTRWRDAATADPETIRRWWSRWPTANIAIATGEPGPDVLDIDITGGKPGRESLARLRTAGLVAGAVATVRTWSGGLHLYYAGTGAGNGAMPRHGVDLRSAGGYVLAPPSQITGRRYALIAHRDPTGVTVDWAAVRRLLAPAPPVPAAKVRPGGGGNHDALVRWVARRPAGSRNDSLYWAARRAVETGAGLEVLAELVAAAVATGLPEPEARRTVQSAQRARTA
jgi:hypothetical protein